MEFNKPVSNPMLVGAIELMKAEDTPEHRNLFLDEVTKASFLSPAIIEPEPTEDEEGKLLIEKGSKVQFPMLSTSDGKRFFMAFTEEREYEKWVENAPKKFPTFALTFDDYAAMILRKDPQGNLCPALGVVINPCGANVILPREMLAGVISSKIAYMQRHAVTKPDNAGPPPHLSKDRETL